MHTPFKVYAQDTQDPIELQINQDLTGLTAEIRTKNLDGGTEVSGPAEIVGPASDGRVRRDWLPNERPLSGALLFVEVIVTFSPGRSRAHPGPPPEKAIIVEVMPRRTQAGA